MSGILEILSNTYSDQILFIVCVSGYLIFLLYYYGSSKWNKFSDFDKIAFSIITGFITLFLIILPISFSYTTLHNFFVFTNEKSFTNFIISTDVYYSLISIICLVLLMGRSSYGGSLNNKKEFQRTIYYSLLVLILFSFLSMIFLYIAFLFSGYNEYGTRTAFTLGGIGSFLLLFMLYYTMIMHRHLQSLELKDVLSKITTSSNIKLTKTSAITALVVVFVIIPVIVGNTCIFKPEIAYDGQEIKEISIYLLPLHTSNNTIEAEKSIERYFVVDKSLLIPWVKIDTGLDLKKAYTTTGSLQNLYYINDTYFIYNGSTEKTNVTAYGIETSVLLDELEYEVNYPPKYNNDTETIYLTLHNNGSHTIEIQYLKLKNNKDYTFEEKSFNKIKDLGIGNGYIGDIDVDESILFSNIFLNGDCNVTLAIDLTKKPVITD